MTDHNLTNQLEELFSDSDAEFELETGSEPSESQLKQAFTNLLGDDAVDQAAAVEPPPPIPAGVKPIEESQEPSPRSSSSLEPTLEGKQQRILGLFMHGITLAGAVLLAVLLIDILRQEPMSVPKLRVVYLAALGVVLIIIVAQWVLNFLLSRRVQETDKMCAEAFCSQARLQKLADGLAASNATLQRRTLQLQTAVQIAQTAAEAIGPDALVERAPILVRECLDLHYVGLFLVDETGQWAVLRAGTGEVGRHLVTQGHQVAVGDTSAVGRCIANGQVSTAPYSSPTLDGDSVPVNPLVPETRSEMALPLRRGNRLIGALEVHSTQRGAFSQEDGAALQTVADQLALAIDQAQQLAGKQAGQVQDSTRQASTERRQEVNPRRPRTTSYYERTRPGTVPAVTGGPSAPGQMKPDADAAGPVEALKRIIAQATEGQEIVVQTIPEDETGQTAVVAPLSLRGEVIGALGLCEPEGRQYWTDDEIALVEAVAEQLVLALENVRLLEETRHRAERDRLIANITARIRSSMDTQTILQTAVRELGTALGSDRTFIRLDAGSSSTKG